jgi:hypothetical protein
VVVVGIRRLPWWNLPQAEAESLSTGLAAKTRAAAPKAGMLIELGIVEIRHSRILEECKRLLAGRRPNGELLSVARAR